MDYGKTTPCCRTATEAERRERPERYDCDTCIARQRHEALWRENVEALDVYRTLSSKVLGGEGTAWILDRWTADWPLDDVLVLLKRLDVIHEFLTPDPTHG